MKEVVHELFSEEQVKERVLEIAEELNISIKTVENQMGKALKALRETAVRIYNFLLGLA